MRKRILVVAATCGLLGAGPALADMSGCTVLLCLLSPTSWTSIPECVSPVRSFLSALKKNKGLSPSCPEQFTRVSQSVVQGERVLTLTLPDGSKQHVAVPAQ
jgi:hypothetical protein